MHIFIFFESHLNGGVEPSVGISAGEKVARTSTLPSGLNKKTGKKSEQLKLKGDCGVCYLGVFFREPFLGALFVQMTSNLHC